MKGLILGLIICATVLTGQSQAQCTTGQCVAGQPVRNAVKMVATPAVRVVRRVVAVPVKTLKVVVVRRQHRMACDCGCDGACGGACGCPDCRCAH